MDFLNNIIEHLGNNPPQKSMDDDNSSRQPMDDNNPPRQSMDDDNSSRKSMDEQQMNNIVPCECNCKFNNKYKSQPETFNNSDNIEHMSSQCKTQYKERKKEKINKIKKNIKKYEDNTNDCSLVNCVDKRNKSKKCLIKCDGDMNCMINCRNKLKNYTDKCYCPKDHLQIKTGVYDNDYAVSVDNETFNNSDIVEHMSRKCETPYKEKKKENINKIKKNIKKYEDDTNGCSLVNCIDKRNKSKECLTKCGTNMNCIINCRNKLKKYTNKCYCPENPLQLKKVVIDNDFAVLVGNETFNNTDIDINSLNLNKILAVLGIAVLLYWFFTKKH